MHPNTCALHSSSSRVCIAVLIGLVVSLCPWPGLAGEHSLVDMLSWDFGGQVRTTGTLQHTEYDGLSGEEGRETFQDLSLETRLMGDLRIGSNLDFTAHYQAWMETGDWTRMEMETASPLLSSLQTLFPGSSGADSLPFLDLTKAVSRHKDTRIVHRLDRFKLSLNRPWGRLSLGRQTLTLGNGLIFNPMDIFNPFSPTAFLRDYKIGEDMALAQIFLDSGHDLRFFHLSRREPESRDVSWNRSSTGANGHFFVRRTEMNVLFARHYKDLILGLGLSSTLGMAAWRFDLTWTELDQDSDHGGFVSAVANLDRSWVWWNKNWYGLIEIFYSGIGKSDLSSVLASKPLLERIRRGELFVLGKSYLAGLIRFEAHPLMNLSGTAIVSMADGSWLFQPKATWNLAQNVDLLLGATLAHGPADSDFGGFDVQLGPQEVSLAPPNTVTLWLTAYF
ncbi:MAG: hypothetical protein U5L00_04515 [Desulfovermiculus sp.]|nr:hypothetical protein [Desulfovermiculus sp.]